MVKSLYVILLCGFFVSSLVSYSQQTFELKKSYYIKGDVSVTGNSILGKYKKKKAGKKYRVNDEIKMRYIDIDDNSLTFSSSSAYLSLPSNSKIKNATLYWSAVYSCNNGKRVKKENELIYECNEEREVNYNQILFKTPNLPYQRVKGNVLFDAYKKPNFNDSAPYVCAADITALLKKQTQYNGWYSVANVKATQGYLSGGSAAGWVLVVTYENSDLTPKYITIYDGLVYLNPKDNHELNLDGFKTTKLNAVKSSLILSAIEGDKTIGRDQVLIVDTQNKLQALKTPKRPERNFFNSTISVKNEQKVNRKPNNENTLGFDLVELDIPNPNNQVISNNQTELKLKFQTGGDRFHLFFAAFKTEIDTSFYRRKKTLKEIKNGKDEINEIKTNDRKRLKTTISTKKAINDTINSEEFEIPKVEVTGLEPGYYIITNVFSKLYLAKRWEQVMNKKGYKTRTFINPENNWHYVSIYTHKDQNKAIERVKKIREDSSLSKSWIFQINLEE